MIKDYECHKAQRRVLSGNTGWLFFFTYSEYLNIKQTSELQKPQCLHFQYMLTIWKALSLLSPVDQLSNNIWMWRSTCFCRRSAVFDDSLIFGIARGRRPRFSFLNALFSFALSNVERDLPPLHDYCFLKEHTKKYDKTSNSNPCTPLKEKNPLRTIVKQSEKMYGIQRKHKQNVHLQ